MLTQKITTGVKKIPCVKILDFGLSKIVGPN